MSMAWFIEYSLLLCNCFVLDVWFYLFVCVWRSRSGQKYRKNSSGSGDEGSPRHHNHRSAEVRVSAGWSSKTTPSSSKTLIMQTAAQPEELILISALVFSSFSHYLCRINTSLTENIIVVGEEMNCYVIPDWSYELPSWQKENASGKGFSPPCGDNPV